MVLSAVFIRQVDAISATEFTASRAAFQLAAGLGIAGDLGGLVRRGGNRRQAHVLAEDVAHLADGFRILLHAVVGAHDALVDDAWSDPISRRYGRCDRERRRRWSYRLRSGAASR